MNNTLNNATVEGSLEAGWTVTWPTSLRGDGLLSMVVMAAVTLGQNF